MHDPSILPAVLPPGLMKALAHGSLPPPVLPPRTLLVLQCLAAGTSFRNMEKAAPALAPMASILLRREPANKYDALAVSLHLGEHHIGYLPRDKNETIARLMDAGKAFEAKLTLAEKEGNWWRLQIDVFLRD